MQPHTWRLPPVVNAALTDSDILINCSFDITVEEIMEFRHFIEERKVLMERNFATTASLLNTTWAQNFYELVSEIRYQASLPFKAGVSWQLIDDNGTHLTGKINPAYGPNHRWFPTYSTRREEAGHYRPWPPNKNQHEQIQSLNKFRTSKYSAEYFSIENKIIRWRKINGKYQFC
jgi:hypothetical protein